MRPLAAAGSWPSIVVEEEGNRLRLSIFPREAEKESARMLLRQLNRLKAYLLAGLEGFVGVWPYLQGINEHQGRETRNEYRVNRLNCCRHASAS